ncbi:unnamed protein product [Closterium sp. NIES-53]
MFVFALSAQHSVLSRLKTRLSAQHSSPFSSLPAVTRDVLPGVACIPQTIPYVEDGDIAPISDPRIFTPEISEHLLAMSKIAKDCMQLPGKERPEMVDVARMLRDVRRRAFGVGAEEIQLDEVPASPLASLYSYHHSQPASGYGTDSYIEFSGPVPK